MIKMVAYGKSDEGKFYVQLCCGEQHLGQKCDCKSLGENFTRGEAQQLAREKANEYKAEFKSFDY